MNYPRFAGFAMTGYPWQYKNGEKSTRGSKNEHLSDFIVQTDNSVCFNIKFEKQWKVKKNKKGEGDLGLFFFNKLIVKTNTHHLGEPSFNNL